MDISISAILVRIDQAETIQECEELTRKLRRLAFYANRRACMLSYPEGSADYKEMEAKLLSIEMEFAGISRL